jgi:hypothetical protein
MPIVIGLVALFTIYLTYKMLVDGWLFKIILFGFGWVGIYLFLVAQGATGTAMTLGQNNHVSWAALVPTAICFLCLLTTKDN